MNGMEILLKSILPGVNMGEIKATIESAKVEIPAFANALHNRVTSIESKLQSIESKIDTILSGLEGDSENGHS